MSKGYLVVWCEKCKKLSDKLTDHYRYYATEKNAQKVYDKLIKLNSVYSASVCSIIKSTDYPTETEC
jgi:hypothetical protein